MGTNWEEIQAYARSEYKLASDEADSFKLVFEYEDERLQAVVVSTFEELNRQWCDFASACCRLEQMDPVEALRRNFAYSVGALGLDKDIYVVRYSVQLSTMDFEEFELPLHVVASRADQIEEEFSGDDRF